MQICAVLTGDIVSSSNLPEDQLTRALDAVGGAARQVAGWRDSTDFGFARQGGDGWQAVFAPPDLAIRAALYIRAAIFLETPEIETRIAVAVGQGGMPRAPGADPDPNHGHGPAFSASGRLLKTLKRKTQMAYAGGGAVDAALRLADAISQDWTQAQARALCQMLPPGAGPRSRAAEALGISRAAVNQALWSAKFLAIEAALEILEEGPA